MVKDPRREGILLVVRKVVPLEVGITNIYYDVKVNPFIVDGLNTVEGINNHFKGIQAIHGSSMVFAFDFWVVDSNIGTKDVPPDVEDVEKKHTDTTDYHIDTVENQPNPISAVNGIVFSLNCTGDIPISVNIAVKINQNVELIGALKTDRTGTEQLGVAIGTTLKAALGPNYQVNNIPGAEKIYDFITITVPDTVLDIVSRI